MTCPEKTGVRLAELTVRFFQLADRKLELLAEIAAVYRQLEENLAAVGPGDLAALIYRGEKLAVRLAALLGEEKETLCQAGELAGREIGSLRQVAGLLAGEPRRRLAAKCRAIRTAGVEVNRRSGILRRNLEVLTTVNRRCCGFFQQVLPVNLGYQASGTVASSPAALRGNGLNHQV
ncbi:MAG: hypothetical protein JRJ56_00425 [Deltaproteobacteria bacterium]|nr:hypothetical protein [Deltaproteobacteria bacterium]